MTTDDSYALVCMIPTVIDNLKGALGCQTHDEHGVE